MRCLHVCRVGTTRLGALAASVLKGLRGRSYMRMTMLCALVLMSGCGGRAQDPVWLAVRASLVPKPSAAAPQGTLAEQQARIRTAVAASGYDGALLMVTLPRREAVATMAPSARSGDTEVWADASGITITLRHGVVIATRGTGFDLMASDMSGRIEALAAPGPRSYTVRMRHLDPEGVLVFSETTCSMRRADGGRVEICGIAPDGSNWYAPRPETASRQWLGPDLGMIHLERLQ